jgi:hypothetical protein
MQLPQNIPAAPAVKNTTFTVYSCNLAGQNHDTDRRFVPGVDEPLRWLINERIAKTSPVDMCLATYNSRHYQAMGR